MVLPDRILRFLMGPYVPKQVPHAHIGKAGTSKIDPFHAGRPRTSILWPFSPPKANKCDFNAEKHSFDHFRPCWKAFMQLNHTFSAWETKITKKLGRHHENSQFGGARSTPHGQIWAARYLFWAIRTHKDPQNAIWEHHIYSFLLFDTGSLHFRRFQGSRNLVRVTF